jgi:hypothetical protein
MSSDKSQLKKQVAFQDIQTKVDSVLVARGTLGESGPTIRVFGEGQLHIFLSSSRLWLLAAYFGVSLSSLLVQGVLGLGLPVPLSVST